jgi:hypothetical protein
MQNVTITAYNAAKASICCLIKMAWPYVTVQADNRIICLPLNWPIFCPKGANHAVINPQRQFSEKLSFKTGVIASILKMLVRQLWR